MTISLLYKRLMCKYYTKLVMIGEELATIAKFEVLGGKPQLPSFLLKILQEIPNWMTSSSAVGNISENIFEYILSPKSFYNPDYCHIYRYN